MTVNPSVREPEPHDLPSLCLAITEHAPLPITTVEGATHIVRYVNPAFCRLMEKPQEQLLGKPISELLPKKDECVRLLDRVVRTKKPESHTEQEHSEPHPVFWSYLMWPVLADELLVGVMIQVTETAEFHGKTVAMNEALMLGAVRQHELAEAAEDLNEQLRAKIAEAKVVEAALRESEEFNRSITESSPDCIKILDLQGNLLSMVRSGQELLGIKDIRPYLNQSWFTFWAEDARPAAQAAVEAAAGGGEGKFVGFFRTLRGEPKWWDVAISPILDANRMPVRLLAVSRDITERKQAEDVLHRAQMLLADRAVQLEALVGERTTRLQETVGELEAFSHSIAHDMRAPLRAITGFARMVQTEHSEQLDETGKEYLGRVVSAAQRLDRLITDVLNYSSVTRQGLDMHPVDLENLLEEAIRNQPELQPPHAQIEIRTPLPKVIAHEPSLMQCATNLLSNAVKFVSPGVVPRVTVRSELVDQDVRLWFEDNGIGISTADKERIFALFGRLNPAAEFEGTGIGLAIVRKAVERMSGRFGVESESGRGSRFWIQLKKGEA